MGYLPAPAVHDRGLRSRPHQSAVAGPNNPGFFILSGATNTKGFEAGLAGYVTDHWQSRAATPTPMRGSSAPRRRPSCRATASGSCRTTRSRSGTNISSSEWAAGVGIIHQTDSLPRPTTPCCCPASPGSTPPSTASTACRTHAGELQINVENIFDTRYYATADGNNNITPGSPRAVRGAIRVNF